MDSGILSPVINTLRCKVQSISQRKSLHWSRVLSILERAGVQLTENKYNITGGINILDSTKSLDGLWAEQVASNFEPFEARL
jgi:hypothetical protein